MRHRPDLRELTVKIPQGTTRADLRPLSVLARPGKPLAVLVDATGNALEEVLSAGTLRARARHETADIHARKCVVAYPPGPDGKTPKPRPLSSHFYRRRASGMEDEARSAGMDMKTFASTTNLNGKAYFAPATPDSKSQALQHNASGPIVCRHLCLAWLDLRVHERARKGTPQAQRFSYAVFATKGAIATHVNPAVEHQFMQLIAQAPAAVVLAEDFGQALAMQLADMSAGESRLYGLVTATHVLAADLQHLQRDHGGDLRDEYIIDVYDPNNTVEHVRASMGSLKEVSGTTLPDWLTDPRWGEYFTSGVPAVLSMHLHATVKGSQVGRHASPPAQRAFLIPQALMAEPAYLYWSMFAGDTDRVRASVAAMVSRTNENNQDLASRLAGAPGGHGLPNALCAAMSSGQADAVRSYVTALVAVPAARLTGSLRLDLLLGVRGLAHGANPAMVYAVDIHPDTARAWLNTVLTSDLPPHERAHLALTRDDYGYPLALRLCNDPPVADAVLARSRQQFLYDSVREALAAPGLDSNQRRALLAAQDPTPSRKRPMTAAQRAMGQGNPGAAGAMVCAVLEAGLDRDQVLAALGVDVDKVLQALKADAASGPPWASRIETACGADRADAKPIPAAGGTAESKTVGVKGSKGQGPG